MRTLGLAPMLMPQATLQDGINAVQATLPLCVFHPRTEDGDISGIGRSSSTGASGTTRRRRSRRRRFTTGHSHPADSFRYLSQGWSKRRA